MPHLIVAADAALSPQGARVSTGWVATNGMYGISVHPQPGTVIGPDATTVAELRAVWQAVSALRVPARAAARIIILTDNAGALRYMQKWKSGEEVYPPGYKTQWLRKSGNISSLEQLAAQMRNDRRYVPRKVKAHAGHPLNEAADALAKLGLRAGGRYGVPPHALKEAAALLVAPRLADFTRSAATVIRD